jgi:hypothetical protein
MESYEQGVHFPKFLPDEWSDAGHVFCTSELRITKSCSGQQKKKKKSEKGGGLNANLPRSSRVALDEFHSHRTTLVIRPNGHAVSEHFVECGIRIRTLNLAFISGIFKYSRLTGLY